MKINHKGVKISLNSIGMNDGDKFRAEQAFNTVIDLYQAGVVQYVDLSPEVKEGWKTCEANLGRTHADPSLVKYISSGDVDIDLSDTTEQVGYKL